MPFWTRTDDAMTTQSSFATWLVLWAALLPIAVTGPSCGTAVGPPAHGTGAYGRAASSSEYDRFEGTWRLVALKQKLAPHEVARRQGDEWVTGPGLEAVQTQSIEGVVFRFEGNRLTISQSSGAPTDPVYWFAACRYEVDATTTPKGLSLTPADPGVPAGDRRAFGACYLMDGDELWICDHEGSVDRPADFSMDVGIAVPKRVFVLRRVR